jgi:hypothetical protein
MICESSWFDAKEYPRASFVLSALVVTLVIAPIVLLGLYYWIMSDVGANNPFPEPLSALAIGFVVAFLLSVPCACSIVLVYRLARSWKGKNDAV